MPLTPQEIIETLSIGESRDWEFKAGKGGVPRSLWETYSAMANTEGGYIVLGVQSKPGQLAVGGVRDPDEAKRSFWNSVNNRQCVSENLLGDDDVSVHWVEGKPLMVVHVPRATRYQRPVYVGQNPLTGTYRRNYEGDYHCSQDEVGRMLADRSETPADSVILDDFGLDDLDSASVDQYRQRFSAGTPNHPWLSEDRIGLLTKLGAWRRERRTGKEGLTAAGLLMFGKAEAIRDPDALPGFHLDYREVDSDDPSVRWTDRLTLDGTWPGNLFQFYQRVFQKLTTDLKTPFQLDADLFRRGETAVHVAIREALVNALIHADYRGQGGIVIEKRRNRLALSNPGTLLVSFEQLLQGGVSECRNKSLQQMFLMIGGAEKAGSGIDKIRQGWASQHWRSPSIQPSVRPDRVRVTLPMVSLLPPESLGKLEGLFGARFKHLEPSEVQALVTAHVEGDVSNVRMQEISSMHSADLTRMLQGLVGKGLLRQHGQGRWTTYRLGVDSVSSVLDSVHKASDSVHKAPNSVHNGRDSLHNGVSDSKLPPLAEMPTDESAELRAIAAPVSRRGRIPVAHTREIVAQLCCGRFLTAAHLGDLMNRNLDALRRRFLKPMVKEGILRLRYPDKPNRPDQAYTAIGGTLTPPAEA